MSEAKTITFSQYYRTRAEDCRAGGNLFRDPGARAEMFKLAIEYDLKAKAAEAAEKHMHHATPASTGHQEAMSFDLAR